MRNVFDFSMSNETGPLEARLSPSGFWGAGPASTFLYNDSAVSYSDPTVPTPPDEPPNDPPPPPEPSPGPFPGNDPPIVFPDPPIGGPIGPG